MPLLVNSVPNLAQGVSQQPDNLRFPGQCDEQINAWATVVEGLVKRPPTEYTKKINSSSTNADKLFTHFVKRSEQNQYCVAVSLGGIGVINTADGTQVSIAVTSIANSYLSLGGQASLGGVANPLADLRALTVADYTFLVNKNRTVQKSTASLQKSTPPADEALIVVKLGDYEKAYSIYVDDKLVPIATALQGQHHDYSSTSHGNTFVQPATYISGPADVEPKGNHADTGFIARDLFNCINENVANAGAGVSSITINTPGGAGSGWLAGNSTGTFSIKDDSLKDQYGRASGEHTYQIKLEVEITQSNAGKAYAELIVTKGKVTAVRNIRRGSSFIGSNPVFLTYKVYQKFLDQPRGHWTGWTFVEQSNDPLSFYGIGLNASSTNSSSDPVQVTTVAFTAGDFEVSLGGSVIKLTSKQGPFNIRAEDGLANQALGTIYREVNNITDLPLHCYNGFGPVKVIGDADIDQDDYYVRFSTKDKGDFGEGSWIETVGYYQDESESSALEGIDTSYITSTMPVTLIPFFNNSNKITNFRLQTPNELLTVKNGSTYYQLEKDNTAEAENEPGVGTDWEEYWKEVPSTTQGFLNWTLGVTYYGPTQNNSNVSWSRRVAGDDNTNPFPSFVGKQIRDLFFFKNRLGILTDSNIIFSEADEYYNFFRTTTQQLLDSAVIDVGLSHTKVAILEHAVPFQEKLMLFSQGSQFVLRGADVLSPKTVAISPVTEYDLSDGIQPVALGNYIYFPFKRKDFEGVYEYFVDNNTETFNAEEITQQVPKYITSDVNRIVGSQSENTIVIGTSKDPKTLFVYKYFWSNKEKVQSAWMKFTFERDVRGFDFIDSELHLITADTDGLHLEKLTLEDGITDTDLDYTLYLDSKVDGSALTTSYDAAAKTTTISGFPYDPTNVAIYTKNGHNTPFTRTSSSAGTVVGDLTSTPFFAGKPYNMLYRFSNQTLKQPTERGGRSASDYAYQTIRNGSIDYADTGHFTVEVTPKYRDTYSYAFNPDIVGANLTLNQFTPQNGHFRFPVQAQPNEATIEVKSDSALPVKLLGAEFESMFIPRSRRYGA
jgi:hypothetical protein